MSKKKVPLGALVKRVGKNRGSSGSADGSDGTTPHIACRDGAKHFTHTYPGPELSLSASRQVRSSLFHRGES